MLVLAERLLAREGTELDDAAILAISEATGVPKEYVRLSVSRFSKEKRPSFFARVRGAFLALEPDDRRYVISGGLATMFAASLAAASSTEDRYGAFGTFALVLIGMGLWNVAISPNVRTAATAGALFGGLSFIARSLFSMLLQSEDRYHAAFLIPFVVGGALGSVLLFLIVNKNRARLGLRDPAEERQDLLTQLHNLQARLREGEQSLTFLSLDIVGSTKMKEVADPLSVEFTFTEYHRFVEMAAKRYGGRIHSTAGDGVTCAFPHPQQAYGAARFIQAGLVELNTHRNKIGAPIRLRAGIHAGTVVAPAGQDFSKINFAHVIDVSAHLQKAAPVGGIAISEAAALSLPGGPASVGSGTVEVESVRAYVWEPKPAEAAAPSGPPAFAPPPSPNPPPAPTFELTPGPESG